MNTLITEELRETYGTLVPQFGDWIQGKDGYFRIGDGHYGFEEPWQLMWDRGNPIEVTPEIMNNIEEFSFYKTTFNIATRTTFWRLNYGFSYIEVSLRKGDKERAEVVFLDRYEDGIDKASIFEGEKLYLHELQAIVRLRCKREINWKR